MLVNSRIQKVHEAASASHSSAIEELDSGYLKNHKAYGVVYLIPHI